MGVESRAMRSVDNTHFGQLQHLRLHKLFKQSVIKISDETVESPVGRQWFHDIETAVMCDYQIVIEIVH